MDEQKVGRQLHRYRRRIAEMAKDAKIVSDMLSLGDQRLLASDGPAGGQLPDLSPEEWGKIYRACKRIARSTREQIK